MPRLPLGLVGTPWAIADEPGSWEQVGGTLLYDALQTAQGKPFSPLKCLYIGTLAPATAGWWHDLVDGGTRGTTYVQALRGDPEKWDQWPEIRRCNPLTAIDPAFRKKLLEERDDAKSDTRLKARFLSYRLNVPTGDESSMLLTVDDWERTLDRPVLPREGKPIVGIDLGGGRAWSAAVALWPNGRVEALATAPGIPGVDMQEKRDRVGRGTYQQLIDCGSLRVAYNLRVQPPAQLVNAIQDTWGKPLKIVCDRFRLPDLKDCTSGIKIEQRMTRWSESSEDIRALRKLAKDGPLMVDKASRAILSASLAVAMVKNDDAGNVRQVKRGTNNTARDDVAAALMLGSGALVRHMRDKPKFKYHGAV